MTKASARKLLLVGAGNMGGALLKGWLQQKILAAEQVIIVDPHVGPQMQAYAQERELVINPPLATYKAGDFSAVVLAVKPQAMGDVLPSLQALVHSETVFLSIAAGKTLSTIAALLGGEPRLVRAMPNTPAAIGRGISALYVGPNVNEEQQSLCESLLSAVGEVAFVETEGQMDAVTAVSGSGPAYVFLMMECLAAAGRDAGLSDDLALQLAKETVSGAGELARLSHETPSQLRENVTSPGGTTAAALDILMNENGMAPLLVKAVRAAVARAKSLQSS